MNDFITEVSFTSATQNDKKQDMFTYISNNEKLGIINCHIFNVGPDIATIIASAVKDEIKKTREALRKRGQVLPLAC